MLEDLVTLGTFQRLLSRVDALVALEGEAAPEALSALGAVVGLRVAVHGLVRAQVGLGFEGFAAGGAGEGSRVAVDQLVVFQRRFIFEELVTNVACEWTVVVFSAAVEMVFNSLVLSGGLDSHTSSL